MDLDLSKAQLITQQDAPAQMEPQATQQVTEQPTEQVTEQSTQDVSISPEASGYDWVAEDEYVKDLLDYYKGGGDIEKYITTAKINYDEYDPLTLHKEALKANYGDLPADMFEEYFNQYIQKQYGVGVNDLGDEDSLAKRLIEKDAESIRQKLKEEQQRFKTGGTIDYENKLKEWQDSVMQLDPIKKLQEEKIVKVKVGDDVVNYEVKDLDSAMDITLNNDKFWGLFADERGQTNWDKWFEVLQFAQDPDGYKKAILNAGKTKGTEKLLDELENPAASATNRSSSVDPFSSAEAFLKSAKIRK